MTTSCTKCGKAYEASSERSANEAMRLCFSCRPKLGRGNNSYGDHSITKKVVKLMLHEKQMKKYYHHD